MLGLGLRSASLQAPQGIRGHCGLHPCRVPGSVFGVFVGQPCQSEAITMPTSSIRQAHVANPSLRSNRSKLYFQSDADPGRRLDSRGASVAGC